MGKSAKLPIQQINEAYERMLKNDVKYSPTLGGF
jgi:D-arabinose 1-dehydrogenase-like Zn-dependent alcohol dehydrogenase